LFAGLRGVLFPCSTNQFRRFIPRLARQLWHSRYYAAFHHCQHTGRQSIAIRAGWKPVFQFLDAFPYRIDPTLE
jgi:hypothetical protein